MATRRSPHAFISPGLHSFAIQYCLAALSLILFGGAARAQVQWSRENPDLTGAAYGNQTFVVVGEGDSVWTSPDSLEWSRHTTGFNADLSAVAFGNGTFVAVGGSELTGVILRSTDGLAWSNQSVPDLLMGKPMTDVAFLNNQFVAVGGFVNVNLSFGIVLTSPDGISWKGTRVRPGLFGVAFGNNRYVAVGGTQVSLPPYTYYSEVLESSDLASWHVSGESVGIFLADVAYGNGVFVAVSEDGVGTLTSNGWKPASSRISLKSVAFGKGLFVATGGDGFGEASIRSSADGMLWTNQVSGTMAPLRRVVFANDSFLAVGDGATILGSPDGLKWTVLQSHFSGACCSSLSYGNGIFVALGLRTVLTSTNGLSWKQNTAGASLLIPRQVAYGAGKFVAVGSIDCPVQAGLITSSDGILWHQPVLPTQNQLQSVVFAREMFVVGGINGPLMTSPDGETWTIRDTETSTWIAITYGNDTFLALGGSWATSTNGIIWRSGRKTTPQIEVTGLAAGKGLFVAIDQTLRLTPLLNISRSRILTSTNGVDWQERYDSGDDQTLNSVGYANGMFVAVGNEIVTSSDGIHWTNRPAVFNATLVASAFGNGYYVAVGAGAIVISPTDESTRPFLSAPAVSSNGAFQFTISGNIEQSIGVQASSNLIDWVTIMTVPAVSQPSSLLDTSATNLPYRFYRAIIPPP
jgi:hypothetical protein